MTTVLTPLKAAAVITIPTTPITGNINTYNANGGAISNILPALSTEGVGATLVLEKDTLDNNTNIVSFTCAGSDTFVDGTTSSLSLYWAGQKRALQVVSVSGTKYWKVVDAYDPPVGLRSGRAIVDTFESTTSTTYTSLVTTSDYATVMVGESGTIEVQLIALIYNDTAGQIGEVSFSATGASVWSASDNYAIDYQSYAAGSQGRLGATWLIPYLTPGLTTIKMQYRVSGGTGTFGNRRIGVLPL